MFYSEVHFSPTFKSRFWQLTYSTQQDIWRRQNKWKLKKEDRRHSNSADTQFTVFPLLYYW